MRARTHGFVALIGALASCGGEARTPGEFDVRDSVGVSIVTYPNGLASAPMWSLQGSPTVLLDEVDGRPETILSQVIAAFRETNGTLVVADATSREIRWFDRNGGHIRTVGGRGEGPGEFRNLSRVLRLNPDTILAWDESGRRLTFFSREGEFLASQVVGPVEEVFESPPGRLIAPFTPMILGFFRDGSILAHPMMLYGDVPAGVYRDSIPLLLFDGSASDWERIGTTLPGEYFFNPSSSVLSSLALPFGLRTQTAVADDWAVIGWGDERGLTIINRSGEPEAIIRPNFVRLPVSQEEIEADRRARVEARAEADRDQYRRELQAVAYPGLRRAHGVIVAGDGEFWVETLNDAVESDVNSWFVFSRSGRFLATVGVPAGFRITDVQDDHIVGVVTDELDVPSVVTLELRRDN